MEDLSILSFKSYVLWVAKHPKIFYEERNVYCNWSDSLDSHLGQQRMCLEIIENLKLCAFVSLFLPGAEAAVSPPGRQIKRGADTGGLHMSGCPRSVSNIHIRQNKVNLYTLS